MFKELKLKYLERKKQIEERLNDFSKVKGEDIFYELCFCILTPQSNAKKCDEAITMLKEKDFLNNKTDVENILKSKTRFYKNKSKYLSELREKFPLVLEKLNEIEDNKDLREWLVKNIKGVGYKEASLPYYERVLIIVDKKVSVIEIGKLFYLFKKGEFKGKRLETFSFNPNTLKFEIAPVTNIMKHVYKKNLYKLDLKLGRSVSVTGDHSVFTFNGEELLPVEVRKLKINDFIAIPRKIPVIDSVGKELNLVEEFIKRDIFNRIYLKSKEYCNFLRQNYRTKINRRNQYTQHFRSIIPLKIVAKLPKETYSNTILKKFKVKISFSKSPNTINTIIKLERDFFWVLGLLIAEAAITKNPIETTLGLEEFKRFNNLNNLLLKIFGVRVKKYKPKYRNVYVSKVHNRGFFYLIRDVLEIRGGSTSKKVPKIVFSTNFSNMVSFLQGYWEGDGWKKSKSYFSVSTNSKELARELLFLLSMVGVNARFCKKKSKGFKPIIANTIDYSGIIRPSQLEKMIAVNKREVIPNIGKLTHDIHKKLKIKTRIKDRHTDSFNKVMRWKHIHNPSREKLKKFINEIGEYGSCEELEKLKRIVDSDISFVQIKKIRKVPYLMEDVYDIEVADDNKNFQNFVGGFGGVCLHNSHFLRNIGHRNLAILDRHILKNLKKFNVIDEIPKTLTKNKYLEIEKKFYNFSKEINIDMDELDLLFWSLETGEIFK